MDAAKSATATFTQQSFALTVTKSGNGTGTVTSNPAGMDRGVDCSQSYLSGTPVTLKRCRRRRLEVRGLERGRVLGDRHLPGHDGPGQVGNGDLHAEPARKLLR